MCRRGAAYSRSLVSYAAMKYCSGPPCPFCNSTSECPRSRNRIWSFPAPHGARQSLRRKPARRRAGHTTEAKGNSRTDGRNGSKKARTRWLDRTVRASGGIPTFAIGNLHHYVKSVRVFVFHCRSFEENLLCL